MRPGKPIILFILGLVPVLGVGCASKVVVKETQETYNITPESIVAFDDAPLFDDKEHDDWFVKEVGRKRFVIPEKSHGAECYFKEGRLEVSFKEELSDADKAMVIGDKIAFTIYNDKKIYKIKSINKNRLGYYVFIDWGVGEENYTGHVLKIMIDFKNKVIWWSKCC